MILGAQGTFIPPMNQGSQQNCDLPLGSKIQFLIFTEKGDIYLVLKGSRNDTQ